MTRDDYDRVRDYELAEEQALWYEAQDDAARARADRFEEEQCSLS